MCVCVYMSVHVSEDTNGHQEAQLECEEREEERWEGTVLSRAVTSSQRLWSVGSASQMLSSLPRFYKALPPPPQTAIGRGQDGTQREEMVGARVTHTQERVLGDRGGARVAIPRGQGRHSFEAVGVSDHLVQRVDDLAELGPVVAVLLPAIQHELVQRAGAVHGRR